MRARRAAAESPLSAAEARALDDELRERGVEPDGLTARLVGKAELARRLREPGFDEHGPLGIGVALQALGADDCPTLEQHDQAERMVRAGEARRRAAKGGGNGAA